ncbi:MAG: response regulator [Gammaproteobacteria bacterium]|nr:response regulator [Gammaproteobacteria bacterium]MDH5730111.1 response regulator [Gammaproteobacteria bacterium]
MSTQSIDVFIAEDDDHISQLLSMLLRREGYKVKVAHNGKHAQQFVREGRTPKLVLLDVMMPYIDGYQILELIREKPEWNDVPVIMLTAKSQEKDVVGALEKGANDYVVKPFQPGVLLSRVKKLMQ